MTSVSVQLAPAVHGTLMAHLLPPRGRCEEAAFIFAQQRETDGVSIFQPVEVQLIGPQGFAHRSPYHLELADGTRTAVIKRAHDLGASIVEMHSHPLFTAEFSVSDKRGLRDFVPHVRWRLKGRPYLAIVVAPDGFDGLAWLGTTDMPQLINSVIVGNQALQSTARSLPRWEIVDEHESI